MKKFKEWFNSPLRIYLAADAVLLLVVLVLLLTTSKPANVNGLRTTGNTYSTVSLKWKEAKNAKFYRVYRSEDGRNFDYVGSTAENRFTDSHLRTGTKYYYAISSRNGFKGTRINAAKSIAAVPELERPELEVDTARGEMKLSYTQVNGAIGYQILRDGEVIGKSSETTYVDETAESDKNYKYEVKAVRYKKQPVYSTASKAVKGVLHAIQGFEVEAEDSDLVFAWSESDYYKTFKIYKGDELVGETEDTSFTLSDYELSTVYDISVVGYSEDESARSPEQEKRFEVFEEPIDNETARQRACDWGVEIAADNSFSYGTGKRAHNFGCYFCGTNVGPNKYKKGKSKSYAKTYCCNPFVTACYAHGAQDPGVLSACRAGTGFGFSAKSFTKYGNWKNIGKPSLSSLQPGDVLLWSAHMMLYIGDGKIVHAKTEGWGAGTISTDKASSYYKRTKFVMRYTGNGSGTMKVIKDVDEEGNVIESEENSEDA